jgi:hypothetical protein
MMSGISRATNSAAASTELSEIGSAPTASLVLTDDARIAVASATALAPAGDRAATVKVALGGNC